MYKASYLSPRSHAAARPAALKSGWALSLGAAAVIALAGSWPLLSAHFNDIQHWLAMLTRYCRHYLVPGYMLYSGVFLLVLCLGVPLVMLLSLLAGVIYNYWEAAALVTASRMGAALVCFVIARYFWEEQSAGGPKWSKQFRRKLRKDGSLYLFMLRLIPVVPDTVINYGMGASSLKWHTYLMVSFIGMIPLTLACVWMGHSLGSFSGLMHFIR